jgi:hypothetical protein
MSAWSDAKLFLARMARHGSQHSRDIPAPALLVHWSLIPSPGPRQHHLYQGN